ncbi:DUF4133 domain-containing protein [Pelobium manganitolerans]|uniref:DUF4133 domain-containing protein n=1 Tax=Pelobium manganitolerans TaxID=1842495 RepID=UPI003FA396C5
MKTSVYKINKNINKPIEFRGLQAQFIWYLALSLACLLILFAGMYLAGFHPLICLAVVVPTGFFLLKTIYSWNSKFGVHGLMKFLARRMCPKVLKINSRKIFC